ncbi:MAG: 2-dehydropantoate 2-reductase [Candidatus Eremiobacteraeota bacterium]|nr:2-dehydropantoate 2-reductase [Candidatus Eremiobacteraeota bacterium]
MRIGIVGVGAIGGFLAGALARANVPVAVVARGTHLAAIRRNGLQIHSDIGSFKITLDAGDDVRQLGEFDFLLLTFKAHQWPALLPQLRAFAGSRTVVVTLQNGVPFWYVRQPPLHSVDPGGAVGRCFPDTQVLGGVVHVSGQVVAPGVVAQSGGLRYVIGSPLGGEDARVAELVEVLCAAGLAAEVDQDVRATVWLKLVNNVGLNTVSALRRMTIRPMLADPAARAEVRALMIEALRVGQSIGAVGDADVDARIAYAARLDDVKTSMLQDLERRRELEIEPIVGAVVELAERNRIAIPGIDEAYAALRRLGRNDVADG